MQGKYCILLGEEDASGDPRNLEVGVELPEVEDKCVDSSSDEFVMMMVSNRLDEGLCKPHLQLSHAILISQGDRKHSFMLTQSAWYHVLHDLHSMMDLAHL